MIQGTQVVGRLLGIMPAQQSLTLGSRQPAEAAPVNSTWRGRQRPITAEQSMLAQIVVGSTSTNWQLYRTGQATEPKEGDSITDAGGVVWQVKTVEAKMQRQVFNCYSVRNQA